jgi:hypothetical protein
LFAQKFQGRSQVGDMMCFDDLFAATAVTDKIHENKITKPNTTVSITAKGYLAGMMLNIILQGLH